MLAFKFSTIGLNFEMFNSENILFEKVSCEGSNSEYYMTRGVTSVNRPKGSHFTHCKRKGNQDLEEGLGPKGSTL